MKHSSAISMPVRTWPELKRSLRTQLLICMSCFLVCFLPAGVVHATTKLVSIGSPLGSMYDDWVWSRTYSGLRADNQYTTGVAMYGAEEIGTAGKITSYAVYKESGDATVVLDSVYIFMKEVGTTKMPVSPVSLDGYTLVYQGDFPNDEEEGWMTLDLATSFVYSGSGNLSVLIVKRSSGVASAQTYAASYVYGTGYGCGYFASSTDSWSDWMTTSGVDVSSSTINTSINYRPFITLGIDDLDPCTTSPTAGAAVASTSTACAGDSVTLSLSGSSLASGITYTWDTSGTGSGGWGTFASSTAPLGKLKIVPPIGRTLYYRCTAVCAGGGSGAVSTSVAVTAGTPKTLPYFEDFESGTYGVNMPCASATRWADDQYWFLYDDSYGPLENHTAGGANYLFAGYALECGTGAREYWWTPAMHLETGNTYRLSFWYMNDGAEWDNPAIGAYIGKAASRAAMSPIGPYFNTANTAYQQYQTDFTVSSNDLYYIGIRVSSTYYYGFAIDDIGLEQLPDCNTATAFATGGKATATPNVVCSTPGITNLSLTDAPAYSGLEYSWEVASGTPTTFTATGSTDRTVDETIPTGGVYYFRCKVTCTATGVFAYSDTVKVMTTPITPPYAENFESGTVGQNLPCAANSYDWNSWAWYLLGSTRYPGLDNHTPGGTKYLFGGSSIGASSGSAEYWFTPGLSLVGGKAYDFSFWYKTDGMVKYDFGARAGRSQSAADMTITVGADISDDNTAYKQFKGAFIAPSTDIYYIGLRYRAYDWWYGAAMDDIGLEQLPPCSAMPAAGAAKATPSMICTVGSTDLSLRGGSMASDLAFQWQTSATGLPGSWADVTGGAGATSSVYTSPVISSGPVYYRCVVSCPLIASPSADTSAPVEVRVGPLTTPYYEDFESATVGENVPCASNTFDWADSWAWYLRGTAYGSLHNHTAGGSKYLLAGSSVGTSDEDYWFTPPINLTAGPTYRFSYWYAMDGTSWSSPGIGAYLGTAQDAGAMSPIGPFLSTSNTSFKQYVADFTVPSDDIYYLGIRVRSTWSWGFSIDDIGLQQLPDCGTAAPGVIAKAGKASASPAVVCSTPGTTTLSLTGTPPYSYLDYEWEVAVGMPSGFVSTGGTSLKYTHTIGGAGTYYFRCKVRCAASGVTLYSDTVKVSTTPLTPPYFEDFETGIMGANMPCADATMWGRSAYFDVMTRPYDPSWTPSLDNHTPGGSSYLFCGWYLTHRGAPDYWFTPGLELTGGQLYQLSYWYNTDGSTPWSLPDPNPIQFQAFYGTTQDASGMTTAIHPMILPGRSTVYKQSRSTFTPASSGVYYIGIYVQGGFGTGAVIDDIGVQAVPPCSAPVSAGTVVADPAHVCMPGDVTTVDLAGATLATGLNYRWEVKTAGAAWSVFSTSTPPVATSGIVDESWIRCIVTCAATGIADTAASVKITAGGMDLPYVQDFESTAVGGKPLCSDATFWGGDPYAGFRVVTGDPTFGGYDNNTPDGKRYLMAGSSLGAYGFSTPLTDDNYWFTPGLNLRTGYKYNVSFYYQGDKSYNQRMGVYYGNAQAAGSMTNVVVPFSGVKGNTYVKSENTITMTQPTGVYYFGFRKSASALGVYSGNGIAFDDININYAPCDGMPVAGALKGSIPSGTALCKGTTVTLIDTGATIGLVPGIKYQWQRRALPLLTTDWSNMPGAIDTAISGDTLIGYEYRMGVVCANTGDTAFTPVYSLPQAVAHPAVNILPATTPMSFCLGDTVHLNATNFSGAVYDWIRDDVAVPGWKFSNMNATEPGIYRVKVVSPLSPCPAYSEPVTLKSVDPGYKVEVGVPADSIICAGTAVTLTASGSKAGLTYQWRKDNVDIPGATGATFVVSAGGYYRVMASDGTSTCLAASRNVAFTVKPNPPAVISVPGGSLTGCEDLGVLLQANTGGYSYQWNRAGSPVFGWVDSAVVVTHSGTYMVKVRSADGCLSESVPVTVNILPSPTPVIVVSGLSSSPTLGTAVATYVGYMWVRNGATTDTAYGPTLTATKKGRYRVIVTDANGCKGESMPVELNDDALGIGDVTVKGSDIRIFPNPTDSKVFIESPVSIRLQVKDASGKTILEKTDVTEVDMSKFADGIYMFLVSDRAGKQLIKEQRVNKIAK